MRCLPALQRVSCGRMIQYVAQKLSRLPAADGKEASYGNGSLLLREVRLEGLDEAAPLALSLFDVSSASWP